jgi:TetR/AcrR family transcriptional repressor of nem operon
MHELYLAQSRTGSAHRKKDKVASAQARQAGRPREFDERAVLEAAIGCFWSQGYQATSLRELVDNMGITGASLYNAFGDKRSLFRRALNHYVDESVRERMTRLESSFPPREAIESFMREIVERSVKDTKRRGCLLVNSALEMAPHDSEFQKIIAGVLTEVEVFFRRLVVAGQTGGTIATERSPDDLARLLLGVLLSVRVLARTRPQRNLLEGMIDPVLALLRAPKRSRKK